MTGRTVLAPTTGATTAGALATTMEKAVVAVATEAPTGAREEEVAPVAAEAGIAAPTAAPEVEETTREVVTTLDAADPSAGGVVGRANRPLLERRPRRASGPLCWEAPTELEAPAPRRTAARAPRSRP